MRGFTAERRATAHDMDEEDEEELSSRVNTQQESAWQSRAYDYNQRFCGHCNTTTDIKEANFIGE